MKARVLAWALAGALAGPLVAESSAAAGNPAVDQAESLYRAGEREMLDEDYGDAIELWTQAYDRLGDAKNSAATRHLRSVIAVNIATLQIGTWERALDPGNLIEGRKILQAYLLQYEAAAGKRGSSDPDLNRVRRKLLDVEALLAGQPVEAQTPADDADSEWDSDADEPRRRRHGGGGGGGSGRKVFRSTPWERFDEPLLFFEFNLDGPAIPGEVEAPTLDPDTGIQAIETVDTQRRRGWGLQIDLWTRPRTMWQLGYARRIWRAEDALAPYELRTNDLSLGLTTDLLALDVDWPVYPTLLPYIRGAYVWGRRDFVDPSSLTTTDKQKIRGGELILGAHLGLVIRAGKLNFMIRGGVAKPFYALWSGGDRIGLQNDYPRNLRWDLGLAFGFVID